MANETVNQNVNPTVNKYGGYDFSQGYNVSQFEAPDTSVGAFLAAQGKKDNWWNRNSVSESALAAWQNQLNEAYKNQITDYNTNYQKYLSDNQYVNKLNAVSAAGYNPYYDASGITSGVSDRPEVPENPGSRLDKEFGLKGAELSRNIIGDIFSLVGAVQGVQNQSLQNDRLKIENSYLDSERQTQAYRNYFGLMDSVNKFFSTEGEGAILQDIRHLSGKGGITALLPDAASYNQQHNVLDLQNMRASISDKLASAGLKKYNLEEIMPLVRSIKESESVLAKFDADTTDKLYQYIDTIVGNMALGYEVDREQLKLDLKQLGAESALLWANQITDLASKFFSAGGSAVKMFGGNRPVVNQYRNYTTNYR